VTDLGGPLLQRRTGGQGVREPRPEQGELAGAVLRGAVGGVRLVVGQLGGPGGLGGLADRRRRVQRYVQVRVGEEVGDGRRLEQRVGRFGRGADRGLQVAGAAQLGGQVRPVPRGPGIGRACLGEGRGALLGQLGEPGLVGGDGLVELVELALQAGEARGGTVKQRRLGFPLVRVSLGRAGGVSQGPRVEGRPPRGPGERGPGARGPGERGPGERGPGGSREREAGAGEALRQVAQHGIDGRQAASRLVGRLDRRVGQRGGGVLLVPADRGEGIGVNRVWVMERAADRAGAALGHRGGQLGAHAVDPRAADAQRLGLRRVRLVPGGIVRLAQLAAPRVLGGKRGAVARYPAGPVRAALGGGEGRGGLAGLVTGPLRGRAGGPARNRLRLGDVKVGG
jgi:hypothetical protein